MTGDYVDVFKWLQLVAQVFELKNAAAGDNSMIVSEFTVFRRIRYFVYCVHVYNFASDFIIIVFSRSTQLRGASAEFC